MKKVFMEEVLTRVADLSSLSKRHGAVATVLKDKDLVFADVVFKDSLEYFRTSHRDGKQARSFGAVETAVRALINADFNSVVVKYLDVERLPEWVHVNDEEILIWEQELDRMGHDARIEDLRKHLAVAPNDAPSKEYLAAFVEGYDRAKREN